MGEYKNQKWTDEYIAYLFELTNVKLKKDRVKMFKQKFPESDFTENAIATKMSEVGASRKRDYSWNKKQLYSERVKKGYFQIKVAQPNVWWQKQRWVYLETHPEEYNDIGEKDCFYFLDGNNRNFNPENIVRVKRREQSVFQNLGGVVKGHPEITKLHLLQARLKLAMLDVGEKQNLTVRYNSGRVFREELNEKARVYQKKRYTEDKIYRQKKLESKLQNYKKLKSDPARYEKHKAYQREWAKKHRSKK